VGSGQRGVLDLPGRDPPRSFDRHQGNEGMVRERPVALNDSLPSFVVWRLGRRLTRVVVASGLVKSRSGDT